MVWWKFTDFLGKSAPVILNAKYDFLLRPSWHVLYHQMSRCTGNSYHFGLTRSSGSPNWISRRVSATVRSCQFSHRQSARKDRTGIILRHVLSPARSYFWPLRFPALTWMEEVTLSALNIVLQRAKEERNMLRTIKIRTANWIGHIWHRNCLLKHVIEGKIGGRMEGTGRRGRRRKKLLHDTKGKGEYRKLRGSTRSHSVENSLWKSLWNFRETDCGMNVVSAWGKVV